MSEANANATSVLTAMERVQGIVNSLKTNLALQENERKDSESEFSKLAGGEESIDVEVFRKDAKEQVDKAMPEATKEEKDAAVEKRMTQITVSDQDWDCAISQSEFLLSRVYSKLQTNLAKQGDGDVITVEKFLDWLKTASLVDDEAMAIIRESIEVKGEASCQDLADGLFEIAFPCPEAKVQRVVDAVRKSFTLSDQAKKEQADVFSDLSGTNNFISKAQYKTATRDYVRKTVLNKKIRALIRHDVKVQRRKNNKMKVAESQVNIGKVTKTDFFNGRSYVHLLGSLASFNKDGDSIMDRPEFVAWLAECCSIHDASYADACVDMFLPEGAQELEIRVLLDCLFERAFPTEEARVQRVVDSIKAQFSLTPEERRDEEKDFDGYCGTGNEFITMEHYREIAKKELAKRFPGKNMTKALNAKVKKMEEKDRNQDGNITKTEFLIHRIFWRFENAFIHTYEEEINQEQFSGWLREHCSSLYSRATGVGQSLLDASAIYDAICPGVELTVLLDGLFDRAFPPHHVRVKIVVEAIRTFFGLEPDQAEKLMVDFDVLNGEEDFIDMDKYIKETEEKFNAKYATSTIPEKFKARLLKKRIDDIKSKDLNGDGKINREEYLNGEIYMELESSLNVYDMDGDLTMDKSEFISWLAEKCHLYEEAYTDAVMQEFLPDGALTLKVDDLTEGLFNRTFPTADYIVGEIVEAVKVLCELTAEEKLEANEDFAGLTGGKDSFEMEEYHGYVSKLVDRRCGAEPSSRKTMMFNNKMEMMQAKDINKDGKISKDEYLNVEMFTKLDDSIREYGANLFEPEQDNIMDLEEFERWLAACCNITDDVKTYALLAMGDFLPEDEDELKLKGFVKTLFEQAFPAKC